MTLWHWFPNPITVKVIPISLSQNFSILVYDHTTVRMFDRENKKKLLLLNWSPRQERNLLYIGKLTQPECDSLVLQKIHISQHYTGWGIIFFQRLYLILLTCCHNWGLNFSQTPHDTHYRNDDSHPVENEWLSSMLRNRI